MKNTVISWSCGGGVQSAGIGVLIGEGALPVPDIMAIVDTGRERRATWDYMHNHLNPYLKAKIGREVVIVPATFKRVDIYDKDGLTIMPAYTKEGRLGAFCSGEWKRDAMERWLRTQGVKDCVQWLGFSADEMRRATGKAHRPWCRPAYPLIDKRLTRGDCIRLVEAAGLPRPPKSRCWQCPHQNAEEWAEVRADPEEWAKAVAMDEEIRVNDPTEREELFLHYSRVPLTMADLTVQEYDTPLFRACQDSGCFT